MATASSLRRLRLERRRPFPALSCCCAARGTGQVPLNDTTGSGPAGADIPWSGSPGPATTPTQTGLILSTAKSGNLSKAYGTHRPRAKTGPSAADEKRSVAGGIFCAVVGTIDVDTSTSFCYDQEDFLKKGGGGVTDRFEEPRDVPVPAAAAPGGPHRRGARRAQPGGQGRRLPGGGPAGGAGAGGAPGGGRQAPLPGQAPSDGGRTGRRRADDR